VPLCVSSHAAAAAAAGGGAGGGASLTATVEVACVSMAEYMKDLALAVPPGQAGKWSRGDLPGLGLHMQHLSSRDLHMY
jgi:hypothetical protein